MTLGEAIEVLGLQQAVQHLQCSRSPSESDERLRSLREQVHSRRRALARTHHPDLGGDARQMQRINAAADVVAKVRVRTAQPQPVVMVNISTVFTSSSTTTTSATDWGAFWEAWGRF